MGMTLVPPSILLAAPNRDVHCAAWTAAARQYLDNFLTIMGMSPAEFEHQIVDGRSEDRIEVRLVHSHFELALVADVSGSDVSLEYAAGEPAWREKTGGRYSAVFADAVTANTLPRLISRCRWLAGLDKHSGPVPSGWSNRNR